MNPWRMLPVLCLSVIVAVVDNTVLNVALPSLARELHASTSDLQWITDAFTLVFAAMLLAAGALGDRFGHRRSLISGLVIFGLGSVASALSTTTTELIAFRAVMGFGGAFILPSTLAILNLSFGPKDRAKALGAWSASSGVGIVIGPAVGGLLLDHFSWSSVFWLNVPLVVVTLIGTLALVPGDNVMRRAGRPDVAGVLLSIAGLVALVDAIIGAPRRGWTSTLTLTELAATVALLGTFVAWERKQAHPILDIRLFTRPAFVVAALATAVCFFSLFGSLFVLTQYLQLVRDYSPLSAGLRALPFAVAMAALSGASIKLTARFAVRTVLPTGLAILGVGLFGLGTITTHTPYVEIAELTMVMGAGMGLIMSPAAMSIMAALPPERAGAGSGTNGALRELGGALGVAIIGSWVTSSTASRFADAPASVPTILAVHRPGAVLTHAQHAFTSGMGTGMWLGAAVALAGAALAALLLPRSSSTEATSTVELTQQAA